MKRTYSPYVCAGLVLAFAPACKIDPAGQIACQQDNNCPTDYPQCVGATATTTGHCAVTAIGTPSLASAALTVSPAAITGGEHPSVALSLPALSGNVDLARKVTLAAASGSSTTAVTKANGGEITVADLGTTISVAAPASVLTDDKAFTYTLTVSNEPGSTASTGAAGTLRVVPRPVLGSQSIGIAPTAIAGGRTQPMSIVLPELSSPASSAASVVLTLSGCGTGNITKAGGGAITGADLGNTISIAPPASVSTDKKTCTYTLTVSNAATTPATVTATGTLQILPEVVLSAATFDIAPAAISGSLAPTLTATLPALASSDATDVSFTLSGCGSGEVTKQGGDPITLSDLGHEVSFDAPASTEVDDEVCTYTLTVSNASASATATGALAIVPVPALASTSLTLNPGAVTGGDTGTTALALPALTSPAASAAVVTVSGCGATNVTKADGTAITAADLGTTINVTLPVTGMADDMSCTYTLSISNSATTPATVASSGALVIVPKPVLASTQLTPATLAVTGGTSGTIDIALPARSSSASSITGVLFTVDDGSGKPVAQAKSGGAAVGVDDLGTTITVDRPVTGDTDDKTLTYKLIVANSATTPATASAVAGVSVVPVPALSSADLTVSPARITGATTPTLSLTLPTVATSSLPPSVKLTSDCVDGDVLKTNGAYVTLEDLGKKIDFDAPVTLDTDDKDCTYTLAITNAAGTSKTAAGKLTIVPKPALSAASFAVTPSAITGGETGTLSITLPSVIPAGSAASVTFTVDSGSGAAAQSKTGGTPVTVDDLGKPITIDMPQTAASADQTVTYTLTVANAADAPATATASGAITVVPQPVLSAATFTLAPDSVEGGFPAVISTTLPALTSVAASAASVSLTTDCAVGEVQKTGTTPGPVALGDLGQVISFATPSTTMTDAKICTYTLKVTNAAGGFTTATASLTVVPAPTFSSALTVTPNVIAGGTSTPGFLSLALPSLSSGTAQTISVKLAPGGADVTKSGAVPFDVSDLGQTVAVDPPATLATDASVTFTYTLSVTTTTGLISAAATTTVTSYPTGGTLGGARVGSTSTLLPNGKVLIVGGGTSIASGACTGAVNTAEVYDPLTGSHAAVPGTMAANRCMHTATLVGNSVFVIGGGNSTTVDVFVYDPQTPNVYGAWKTTNRPTVNAARYGHSATLLSSGNIVVAGGYNPATGFSFNTVELLSTGAGTSTTYAAALSKKRGEAAALLAGKWLCFIGGHEVTNKAETYLPDYDVLDTTVDPSTATFTNRTFTGAIARAGAAGWAISSTSLLVAGGVTSTTGAMTDNVQVWTLDPATGLVTATTSGALATARARFALVPAGPIGKYLAIGGTTVMGTTDTATSSIEIIDTTGLTPAATSGGNLASARQAFQVVNLAVTDASNSVLIAAGGASTGSAELLIGP